MSDQQNPPTPPKMQQRRAEFHLLQLVAIPIILLIPILALFGVFGVTRAEATTSSADLTLHVEYTSRLRYGLHDEMQITVTNQGDQPAETLRVHVDTGYLRAFFQVRFVPEVATIDSEAYIVVFSAVAPGESRQVTIDLQPDGYGAQSGSITAEAEGLESATVTVATFIFP